MRQKRWGRGAPLGRNDIVKVGVYILWWIFAMGGAGIFGGRRRQHEVAKERRTTKDEGDGHKGTQRNTKEFGTLRLAWQ